MDKKLLNNVIYCLQDKKMVQKNGKYFIYHRHGTLQLNNIDIKKLFEKYNEKFEDESDTNHDWGLIFGSSDNKSYGYSLELGLIGPFYSFTRGDWINKTIKFIHSGNASDGFEKELVQHVEAQGFIFLGREILLQRIDIKTFYITSDIFLIYSALFRDYDIFPFNLTEKEEEQYEKKNIINDDTNPLDTNALEDFKKTENYKKWKQWLDDIEKNAKMYIKDIELTNTPTLEELENKICIDILIKRQDGDPKYFTIFLKKKNMNAGSNPNIIIKMLRDIIEEKYSYCIKKEDRIILEEGFHSSLICLEKVGDKIIWRERD